MPAAVVFAVYGCAVVIALALLVYFRARSWYWHALSMSLALVIGLIPLPEALRTPAMELFVGGVFLLLMLWGICAPLFRGERRHHHHAPPHHA